MAINIDRGYRKLWPNQPFGDGKAANAGRKISAHDSMIDLSFGNAHFDGLILDINAFAAGARHNCHFAGQWIGTSQTVNLARVGASHQRQQDAVALTWVSR